MSKSFATIKRGQAILTNLDVTDEIAREMIELAKLLEQESPLTFDVALGLIESICEVILPGHRGIAKLLIFRTIIRERLKNEFIGFEEAVDHQQTTSDARHAGCP